MDEAEVLGQEDADSASPSAYEADDIADQIAARDSRWSPGRAIEIEDSQWRPHLLREGQSAVLHVHLSERLRAFAETRLRKAHEAGLEVHVATLERQLYNEELLQTLVGFDALLHVIDESGNVSPPERALATLADRQLTVGPAGRHRLTLAYLEKCRLDASAQVKGKRFEALLAFLFSQVTDFVVRERNYRTETEEIDIVVQQRATQGRAWATLMAPFVLIEAKNRQEGITQEVASAFFTKMSGKRKTVRLGFLCSTTIVTGDARTQELRFSGQDLTVVFLDHNALKEWCGAHDFDEHLEQVVTRAMLR